MTRNHTVSNINKCIKIFYCFSSLKQNELSKEIMVSLSKWSTNALVRNHILGIMEKIKLTHKMLPVPVLTAYHVVTAFNSDNSQGR